MPDDYYSLLGVDPDATEEAILQAYRRKAATHHPDVNDDPDADATFRRLNRAKAVLTDENQRCAYDRLGHEAFEEREESGDGGSRDASHGRSPADTPSTARRSPARFRDWPAGVGSLLEHLFRGPTAHPAGRAMAADSGRVDAMGTVPDHPFGVDLRSLFQQANTGERTERRTDDPECPKCGGRGTFVHLIDTGRGRRRRLEPCERCDGDGTIPR